MTDRHNNRTPGSNSEPLSERFGQWLAELSSALFVLAVFWDCTLAVLGLISWSTAAHWFIGLVCALGMALLFCHLLEA